MRDSAHPIKSNVVLGGYPAQTTLDLLAQGCGLFKLTFEGAHGLCCQRQETGDTPRAGDRAWVGALAFIDRPTTTDFTQSMMERFNQQGTALGVIE